MISSNVSSPAVGYLRGTLVCILLVASALGPTLLSKGVTVLLTEAFCLLVLAMMWNLLAGFANIVTVGQHAFVGIGCYAFYWFAVIWGVNPYCALLLAAFVPLLVALPVFAIVFRLRDAYFAVSTWVVAEVMMLVSGKLAVFGGGSGRSLPPTLVRFFGATADSRAVVFYWLALSLLTIAAISTYTLLRSRIGLGLRAMRDDEDGAATSGVNLFATRVICFLWTTPFLGAAGALITLQKLRISPTASFSMVDWTVYITFIVVIGGLGSLEGPIIGTVLFLVLREYLSDFGTWHLIVLGLISIVTILIEPRGIWGLITRRSRFELVPLSHRP